MQHLVDNRYRVVWKLTGDEMVEVYLARDDILGREIVLKVLSGEYADDNEFVEHFRKEARNVAALSHPNIVSVFDQGETEDGTYYIAMEYLSGGSLKERLTKLGPLSARRAAAVALQISRALRAAHDSGVVHGGLKPNNVLITESGDVKVKDFGIARDDLSVEAGTANTRYSDPYLAPEQAAGGEATRKSDLYSLGVVLYEMLAGETPHDTSTSTGIGGSGSEDANAIATTLISENPDDRYADADELIEDLERVGAGLEPENAGTRKSLEAVSHESGVPRRVARKRDRGGRRILLLVMTLLTVVLLAGLTWAGFGLLQTSTQEQQQPEPQPQPRQEPQQEPRPQPRPQQEPRPEPQPVMLQVPDLEGMTLEEARQQVGEDFEIVEDGRENSSRPENTILSHKPSDGQAEKGAKIQAVVASGQNEVPAVESVTQQEALNALSEAGFEPTVTEAESTVDGEGFILSQNPAAGGTAGLGAQVEIVVGTGPAPVEVPSIYGYTADEAAVRLQRFGLVLGGSDTAPSDEVAKGGIIAQSFAPGASVEPGTAVGVTISSGPERIPVPNVVGQSLGQARQNIANAGFSYNALEIPNARWPRGTVLYTDPGTGTPLLPDSTVTIGYSSGPSGPSAPKPAASSQNNRGGRQAQNRPAQSP